MLPHQPPSYGPPQLVSTLPCASATNELPNNHICYVPQVYSVLNQHPTLHKLIPCNVLELMTQYGSDNMLGNLGPL